MPPQAKSKPADPAPEEEPTAETAPEEPMFNTKFGLMTEADYLECIRAEVVAEMEAKAAAAQAEADARLPELCEEHFPEGWESKNAVGQDGVGCEHGSWNRKQTKE